MTILVRFRGEEIPYSPRLLKPSQSSKTQTLPPVWIGFDSEGVDVSESRAEVITFQTYNGERSRLEYVKSGDAFRHFWSLIVRSIPSRCFKPLGKDLQTIPVYCHNWGGYDWGMIVKDGSEAWRNMSRLNHFYKGYRDTFHVERMKWKVTVEGGHMLGNASTLSVVLERKGVAVRIRLLDTFPFFPKSLASVAKDLGLEKGDRASVIGVDWRDRSIGGIGAKDEKGRVVLVTRRDFEQYARHDAELVWALGGRIRELHAIEGLTSIAVSGAGYAAKVLHRNLAAPVHGGFGGIAAVQIALDAFHGGRSGRLVHGRISGGSVYDFRSSYPSIQSRLPVLHSDYTLVYHHKNLAVSDFMNLARRYHGFARVDGCETDLHYPAILAANEKGSIRPLVGEFQNAPATAAEFYLGVVYGGLRIDRIREAVFYVPKPEYADVFPFRPFTERAYARKNSFPKGTIEYDAAKIQANSGYGKLIEHRGSQTVLTDDLQIALGPNNLVEDVREFFLQYHPDSWFEVAEEWNAQIPERNRLVLLRDLVNLKPEFGFYAIPQYATWITGHAHARLVLMMRLLEAVKWDTDSVTTLLSEAEVQSRIDSFDRDRLPLYIQPLSIGAGMGELDMEGRNLTGWILGNKRYYLEGEVWKDGKWIPGYKEGHHGLPAIRKEDIKGVLSGENRNRENLVYYVPKPKPIKIKGSRDWDSVGRFVEGGSRKREVNPTFAPDPKQDFKNGGAYLPFGGFK